MTLAIGDASSKQQSSWKARMSRLASKSKAPFITSVLITLVGDPSRRSIAVSAVALNCFTSFTVTSDTSIAWHCEMPLSVDIV